MRLGEFDFSRTDETQAVEFNVAEVKIHQDFVFTEGEELSNDLAILTLDGKLDTNRTQEWASKILFPNRLTVQLQ